MEGAPAQCCRPLSTGVCGPFKLSVCAGRGPGPGRGGAGALGPAPEEAFPSGPRTNAATTPARPVFLLIPPRTVGLRPLPAGERKCQTAGEGQASRAHAGSPGGLYRGLSWPIGG